MTRQNSVVLIKLGGAIVHSQLDRVVEGVQQLRGQDVVVAIVHGAGPQIDEQLAKQGIAEHKINGLRVTDDATLQVVAQAQNEVNDQIARALKRRSVTTQQCKHDIFIADLLDQSTYGLVGKVRSVKVEAIIYALTAGAVPIISSLGWTATGTPLNVNGDAASTALALALNTQGWTVTQFITLTDTGGVQDKDGQIIPIIDVDERTAKQLINDRVITTGMIPKIEELAVSVQALPTDTTVVITQPDALVDTIRGTTSRGTIIRKAATNHHDQPTFYTSLQAIDLGRAQALIEKAFGATLHADYFKQLPNAIEIFVAGDYEGLAVVFPNSPNGPAYVDKLAIDPAFQGKGVGSGLIKAAINHHPEGLYWRARASNTKTVEWYSKIANHHQAAGEWVVFFANVDAAQQSACVQQAVNREITVLYNTR